MALLAAAITTASTSAARPTIAPIAGGRFKQLAAASSHSVISVFVATYELTSQTLLVVILRLLLLDDFTVFDNIGLVLQLHNFADDVVKHLLCSPPHHDQASGLFSSDFMVAMSQL